MTVDAFMALLDHPLKQEIEKTRKAILTVSAEVQEAIKWNAPSFKTTDFFATFHLRSRERVQLVLHTGAKAKDNPNFVIDDPKKLLTWRAKDRALVTLGAGEAFDANLKAFVPIIKQWIAKL